MPVQRHVVRCGRRQVDQFARRQQRRALLVRQHAVAHPQAHRLHERIAGRHVVKRVGAFRQAELREQERRLHRILAVKHHQRRQLRGGARDPVREPAARERGRGHQPVTHHAQRTGAAAAHRRRFARDARHRVAAFEQRKGVALVVEDEFDQQLFVDQDGREHRQQPGGQRVVVDRQRDARRARVARHLGQKFRFKQRRAAQVLQQPRAGRGRAAGPAAHQQRRAHVLLERRDALRDGRGRDVELDGGRFQAAGIDGGKEGGAAAWVEFHACGSLD